MIMEILTPQECAEMLKVSLDVLRRLRQKGGGPPYFKVKGRVRYDKEAVNEWVKSQEARYEKQISE